MDSSDTVLDVEMASLQLNERKRSFGCCIEEKDVETETKQEESEQTGVLRRSLRKRMRSETDKRRVVTKPKKIDVDSVSVVTSYYLDKKVKRAPSTLETIFEEPKQAKTGCLLMSGRKFKRLIEFNAPPLSNDKKVKKRKTKAKALCMNKKLHHKRFTKEFLLQKLSELDDET